jgi:hypothetical protein
MNFAEQLADWYLRLNGFIPLTNFVLHDDVTPAEAGAADGPDRHLTSDADLIAVRFPHVSERIGGNPHDWDRRHFDQWGVDYAEGPLSTHLDRRRSGPALSAFGKSAASPG